MASKSILPLLKTIEPADEAGVAEAVRAAAAAKTAVYPIGGGTSLDWGAPATRPGIGISTAAMRRIIDYPADDLTITVEAGLPVAELGRRLKSHRQWLPIDVPQPERATVGGIVAANVCGPRRYAYGTLRDYLLGVRMVDGLGKPFNGGGRVVKNAAGYNVPRLSVGSFGTLGVITQATLMVRPRPEYSAMVVCDAADFEVCESLLSQLMRSRALPVAIEMLAGPERSGCPLGVRPTEAAARLIVGMDGSKEEVEWMVKQVRNELLEVEASLVLRANDSQVEPLWTWLAHGPSEAEITVLPGMSVAMVEEVVRWAPGATIQAHAGSGIVRFNWPEPASPASRFDIAAALVQLRPAVAAAEGKIVALHCPEQSGLTSQDIWGPQEGNGLAAMRAIQERFDPHGILNPGRFPFASC